MGPDPAQLRRAAERERMVAEQLAQRGITSASVLDAMRAIPRECFLPECCAAEAYADRALPVDCGQTISQPYMVALMTELLRVPSGGHVLEIGTGTGYQAAILARLCARVLSIERIAELADAARQRLAALRIDNVFIRVGDGTLGCSDEAPYDGIIVTAGAPGVPRPLQQQLRVGARLVIPIGPLDDQELIVVQRGDAGFTEQSVLRCRFVKLIGQAGWHED